MEYYPIDPLDDGGEEVEFYEVDGLLIHPGNSWIDCWDGNLYDHITTQLSDDPEDLYGTIVPHNVLLFLANRGFKVKQHGAASEELREWFAHTLSEHLDNEITNWQKENPSID